MMRSFCLSFLLLWLLAVPGAVAQETNPLAVLAELPKCAQSCLLTALDNSPCQMTNMTCMCSTESFMDEATQCVFGSCSIREALTTKNMTMSACGVTPRDVSHEYAIMSNTLAAFIVLSVLARVISKLWWRMGLQADDWIVALTTLFLTIPCLAINVTGLIGNGMGRDVWTVPFDQITDFGMWFHVIAVLYFAQIPLLKLSLLVFCLRIFPQPGARKLLWATIIFNCAFGVAFILVDIFKCLPVSYFQTRWDGEHEGTCSNVNAITWSNAAISIAVDIWMLAIPLTLVRSLNMDTKKKIQAAMWFFVGTLYTVVSVVRLHILVRFGGIQNATWDYLEVCKWSTIEICAGIICVCMPYYRLLFVRIFPCLGSYTSRSYSRYPSDDNKVSGGGNTGKKQAASDKFSSDREAPRHQSEPKGPLTRIYDAEMGDSTEHDEIQLVSVKSPTGVHSPASGNMDEEYVQGYMSGYAKGYMNGRLSRPKSAS